MIPSLTLFPCVGEIVVLAEDDLQAKNIVYRFCPSGNCPTWQPPENRKDSRKPRHTSNKIGSCGIFKLEAIDDSISSAAVVQLTTWMLTVALWLYVL